MIDARTVSRLTKRLLYVPLDLARNVPPTRRIRELRRRRKAQIPQPALGFSPAVGAALDRAFIAAVRVQTQRAAQRELPRVEAEVAAALEVYEREGWLTDPLSFHGIPTTPDVSELSIRVAGRKALALNYKSSWEPPALSPGRERWIAHTRNSTCSAYVLRRPGPGRWVVCLHGARMGRPALDARFFHARELFAQGLNVVMPILPLHGARRAERGTGATLPAPDVMDNIHGMAQATADVRELLNWLRTQGATGITLWGLSLGGYVAALTASLEPELAGVITTIPAVDLPRVMASHIPQRLKRETGFRELNLASTQLHRVVSPLVQAPATPVDRRFIVGARSDHVLDPVDQTAALWKHWDRPEILWLRGGHVTSSAHRDAWAFTLRSLESSGQLPAR